MQDVLELSCYEKSRCTISDSGFGSSFTRRFSQRGGIGDLSVESSSQAHPTRAVEESGKVWQSGIQSGAFVIDLIGSGAGIEPATLGL